MATPNRTYVSDGQVLESPPLSARLSRSVDNIYNFFGLYFVSLFSLDPYTAAENSHSTPATDQTHTKHDHDGHPQTRQEHLDPGKADLPRGPGPDTEPGPGPGGRWEQWTT